MYTKRVAKNKYGLSIKDSRNLKNQSENNDDNNNVENNCKNTNLDGTLIFQDTGNNVVWNSRKSCSRKTFLRVFFVAICLIVLLLVCSFVFVIF